MVSRQKLHRPPPPPVAEAISLDVLNGTYTADGLGNRTSNDMFTARGGLSHLPKRMCSDGIQSMFDWKITNP